MLHYVNSQGEIEYSFYESVMEIPWFRKVAEESTARLEAIYAVNPDACSSWYKQYRAEKKTEDV